MVLVLGQPRKCFTQSAARKGDSCGRVWGREALRLCAPAPPAPKMGSLLMPHGTLAFPALRARRSYSSDVCVDWAGMREMERKRVTDAALAADNDLRSAQVPLPAFRSLIEQIASSHCSARMFACPAFV